MNGPHQHRKAEECKPRKSSNARKQSKGKGKKRSQMELKMEEKKDDSPDAPATTRRPPHPSRAIMIAMRNSSSSSETCGGEGNGERRYNRGECDDRNDPGEEKQDREVKKHEAETLPPAVMIALRASSTGLYDDDIPRSTGHKKLDPTRDDQNKDASLRRARKPKRKKLERTNAKGHRKRSQSVQGSLVSSEKSQSAKELGHCDRRMKSKRRVKSSGAVLSEGTASETSAESRRMLADVEIGALAKSPSLHTTSTASASTMVEPSSLSLEREAPYSRPGAFRVGGIRRSVASSSSSSSDEFWAGSQSSDESDDEEVITADVQRCRSSLLANARSSVTATQRSRADKNKRDTSKRKKPPPTPTKARFTVWRCAVIGFAVLLLTVVVVVVVVLADTGKRTSSSEVGNVEALRDNPVLFVMVVQWAAAFDSCGSSIQEPLEIEFECGFDGEHYVEVLGFQHSQNQSSSSIISCESREPGVGASNRQTCQVQSVKTDSALVTSEVDFMVGCSVLADVIGIIYLKTYVKPIAGSSCGRPTSNATSQVVGEVSTGVTAKHLCPGNDWALSLPQLECNGGTSVSRSYCSALGSCTGNSPCSASTTELDLKSHPGYDSVCFMTSKNSNSDFVFYTSDQINHVWDKVINSTTTDYAEQNHWSLSTLGPP